MSVRILVPRDSAALALGADKVAAAFDHLVAEKANAYGVILAYALAHFAIDF